MVLISGFGVMLLLWWNYQIRTVNASELPGLFDYRAATLGDAICLPLMISSAFMLLLGQKLTNAQTIKSLIISVVSMLIGVIWQASWLLNPNIDPNWTIPKAHYFNLAGWYHACFFVVMFGVSTFLAVSLFYLRKDLPLQDKSVRKYFHLYFNMITLFVSLYLLDDYVCDTKGFGLIVILFLVSFVLQFVFLRNSSIANGKTSSETDTARVISPQNTFKSKSEEIMLGGISGLITLCSVLIVFYYGNKPDYKQLAPFNTLPTATPSKTS